MVSAVSGIETTRVYVLFLCLVRHVVEGCGGTMEVDRGTYGAHISIPERQRARCLRRLDRLPSWEELYSWGVVR